jgi:integrase
LIQILNSINRTGKGKLNVMYCLHACLDYAWRSGRIKAVPPFPKRKQYHIQEPQIRWLPESRQIAIIKAIPTEHQPIFWWLKYHYRRPGEACALHKADYKDGVFTVRRTFSNRVLTESTKTGDVHKFECHSDFLPIIESMSKALSPFFFVNPYGKQPGKPYSLKTLGDIWGKACQAVGENINLYAGLKHSSCGQFLNEKGGSFSDLQVVTDHKRLESVKRYGEMALKRRRELMERKVIGMPQNKPNRGSK